MEISSDKLKTSKWPFALGQILLLGLAYLIVRHSPHPISMSEILICFAVAAAGAFVGVLPFLLDYRIMGKQIEALALGEVTEKLQNLKVLSAQISSATNEWTNVHTQAEKTANSAKEIGDRMTEEIRQFSEFMQKINDNEKATLRLEVEKSQRNEGEWVQTLVRILDHIYALQCAAARSGQPQVATQIENFQGACRSTARRMGLTPFMPNVDEPFDPERHQAVGDVKPSPNAVVTETVGTGYTFQGKFLRPAIVKVREAAAAAAPAPDEPVAPEPIQEKAHGELPL